MANENNWYVYNESDILIKIYLQPGSKYNEIVGLHGDELKIKLVTRAIDGKANLGLIRYLAKLLDIAQSHIEIIRGSKSKHKLIKISQKNIILDKLINKKNPST